MKFRILNNLFLSKNISHHNFSIRVPQNIDHIKDRVAKNNHKDLHTIAQGKGIEPIIETLMKKCLDKGITIGLKAEYHKEDVAPIRNEAVSAIHQHYVERIKKCFPEPEECRCKPNSGFRCWACMQNDLRATILKNLEKEGVI